MSVLCTAESIERRKTLVNTKQINYDLYVHAYLGLILHICFFSKIDYVSIAFLWNAVGICVCLCHILYTILFLFFSEDKDQLGGIFCLLLRANCGQTSRSHQYCVVLGHTQFCTLELKHTGIL